MLHSILASDREKPIIDGSTFMLGGRQTIFLKNHEIETILKKYQKDHNGLDSKPDQATLRSRSNISDTSLFQGLFGLKPESIDATQYEGASLIADLNVFPQIMHHNTQNLESVSFNKFDYVYDGGCLDNVFSPSNALFNFVSFLKPGGRIINWVAGTNWPGVMCAITPEWLLGFYVANNFANIRVYTFSVVDDDSTFPNSTVNVFRYSPIYSRHDDWNPHKAAMGNSSHPVFTIGFADFPEQKLKEFVMPMNIHYINGQYADWRNSYVESPNLPFEFDSKNLMKYDLPLLSDHYSYIGTLNGF
jgi:hypothetical protein